MEGTLMDRRSESLMQAVGAVTVLLIIAAIVVHATVGWSEIGAAWVQAVGTIVGLSVAIWVPTHIREVDRAESKASARARALVSAGRIKGKLLNLELVLELAANQSGSNDAAKNRLSLAMVISLYEAFELPSDDDVLALEPLGGGIAAMVAGCLGNVGAMRSTVKLAQGWNNAGVVATESNTAVIRELWESHDSAGRVALAAIAHCMAVLNEMLDLPPRTVAKDHKR